MTAEQDIKIGSAAAACLEECGATDRPYSRVSAFIGGLQGDEDWSDAEIIELQTRVIKVLLYRYGNPGKKERPTGQTGATARRS